MHVDSLSGFGEDAAGRLYAASLGGPVYRIDGDAQPAPPGPSPGGGSPPGDTKPPKLTLNVARRQHVPRTHRFVAKVTCDEQCALVVSAKRTKTRRVSAAAGAQIRFVLHPSRRALRLWSRVVRRHRMLVIRIRVRATDGSGNAATRSARVRVLR
jgi:hypothetical protein